LVALIGDGPVGRRFAFMVGGANRKQHQIPATMTTSFFIGTT
jgi:hypothetical protein